MLYVSTKVIAVSRRFGRTQPDGMLQNKEWSKDLCDTDVAIRIWLQWHKIVNIIKSYIYVLNDGKTILSLTNWMIT